MRKTKQHIDSKAKFHPLGSSNRDRQTRKTSLRGMKPVITRFHDEAIPYKIVLCQCLGDLPAAGKLLRHNLLLPEAAPRNDEN